MLLERSNQFSPVVRLGSDRRRFVLLVGRIAVDAYAHAAAAAAVVVVVVEPEPPLPPVLGPLEKIRRPQGENKKK